LHHPIELLNDANAMLRGLKEIIVMAVPKFIDIDDEPQLRRILTAIREGDEPVRLRIAGEEVAVIRPLKPRRPHRRVISDADLEALRSVAGSWKDVDTDRLLKDIYADRDLSIGR
jgi:hypothetical protein